MNEVQIPGEVFAKLLDAIIEKANQVLEEEKKYENREPRLDLKMSQKRLFGYDEYRRSDQSQADKYGADRQRTISAALYYYFRRPKNKEVCPRNNLNVESLNPRTLDMAYAKYKRITKGESEIPIVKSYLILYLAFIGYDSLADFIREKVPDVKDDGPERHFYYRCHYYSTKDKELKHFDATFIDPLDPEKNMEVHFRGSDLSTSYSGEIEVYEQEREAIITAWSTERTEQTATRRPLLITITKQTTTPFHWLKVCVGYYLNAGRDQLENSSGLIIFEQLDNRTAPGVLTDHHLRHFLMHPPNGITDGGFESAKEFLKKHYKPYEGMSRIAEAFTPRYYKAFLLSKKARDGSTVAWDYLELSKFEFYEPYRVKCVSNYTVPTEFAGELTFMLPNRVQIDMTGEKDSHYRILLDIPALGFEGDAALRGVYSGMTQNGFIAAGRVVLYPVSKETYASLPVNIYPPDSAEARQWTETYKLDHFFAGQDDNYLDNLRAGASDWGPLFTGTQDLKHLPGVYYYYRTRTIRGRMREVKRFPVLLKPNGRVIVKIKAGGEFMTAVGKAVRIKDCIYIQLEKPDRYDGLAILWPPSLGHVNPMDEIIPAMYVSNSKRFHITAGRLFFIRQFTDESPEDFFEQLKPSNISLDNPEDLRALTQKERVVLDILKGQLNNYMAVRHATELKLPDFASPIFMGACYQARTGAFPAAFETLYLALLRAGYRDEDWLRSVFGPEGDFAGQEQAFRDFCEQRYDTIHNQDQRDYLSELFVKIFPSS